MFASKKPNIINSSYVFSDAFHVTNALSEQLYVLLLLHLSLIVFVEKVEIRRRRINGRICVGRCRRRRGHGGAVSTVIADSTTQIGSGHCRNVIGARRRSGVRGRTTRAWNDLEREELVFFARKSTQYAEQVGVVVVLQNVAHFCHVI